MSEPPTHNDLIAKILGLRPKVLEWLRVLGSDSADREDLAQQILDAAVERVARYDPARSKLKTWIYGFAVNFAKDQRRQRGRFADVFVEDLGYIAEALSPDPTPEELCSSRSVLAFVRARLQGMNQDQLDVLWACDLHSFTEEEAAQVFNVPKGTIKSRLHAARKEARSRLEPYKDEIRPILPILFAADSGRNDGGLLAWIFGGFGLAAGAAGLWYGATHHTTQRTAVPFSFQVLVNVETAGASPAPAPAPTAVAPQLGDAHHARALVQEIRRAVVKGDTDAARLLLIQYLRLYPHDPLRARAAYRALLRR